MPKVYGLVFLLCVAAIQSGEVVAQDSQSSEQLPPSSESRLDWVYENTDPPEHAGLLGKRALSGWYLARNISTRYDNNAGDIQGFRSLLNLPALSFGTDHPIDVDFGIQFGHSELDWNRYQLGPTWDLNDFVLGATIHTELTERFRPFLAIGADFAWQSVKGLDGPDDDTITRQQDIEFLFQPGLEFDITEFLAYRLTVATNTDSISHSAIFNDFIVWPHERFFLHAGAGFVKGGSSPLFLMGGGLTF